MKVISKSGSSQYLITCSNQSTTSDYVIEQLMACDWQPIASAERMLLTFRATYNLISFLSCQSYIECLTLNCRQISESFDHERVD